MTSRWSSSASGPARSFTKSFGATASRPPTSHAKILRCAGRPVDPVWLEEELAELERLVETGETLDVVARLVAMTRSPRRLGARAAEPV